VATSFVDWEWQLHDPGLLMLSVQLGKEQSIEEARHVAVQVIEGVAGEPATKQEVDRVNTRMLNDIELSFSNPEKLGLSLSKWIAGGDWRLLFVYRDQVRSVTERDVTRVAKAYLRESNRTIGVYIPETTPDRVEIPAAPDINSCDPESRVPMRSARSR
jgi:zinc protease